MSDEHNPKDDTLHRDGSDLAEHRSQHTEDRRASDGRMDALQRDMADLRVSQARLEAKAEELEKNMDRVHSRLDRMENMIMIPLWSAVLSVIGLLIRMTFFG
ncbi:MAG: hypothetical protein ISN29_09330 [Gammaproteobacteria bacterium AqS3]|nr:hypothetical protein [Gammaproteobacteria bacterium AqS3]